MAVLPILTETPGVKGPPQGQWTVADWETLPDDGNRYEIIYGVLYMTTAPSPSHQWAAQMLYELLGIPFRKQGLGYAYLAPIGLVMAGVSPVQPDLVLIRKENAAIIGEKRLQGVPDLIVEVLSPGSTDYDEDTKLNAYAKAGVPEYAVIDPKARALRLYRLESAGHYGEPTPFSAEDRAAFACAPGIEVPVGALFEGAPDTTL